MVQQHRKAEVRGTGEAVARSCERRGRAFGSCKARAVCARACSCRGIVQGCGVERTHAGGISAERHEVQTIPATSVVAVLDRARVGAMLKCVVTTVSSPRWWCCARARAMACEGMAARHRVQVRVGRVAYI